MAGYIVDRRLSGRNKSVPNRVRFMERVRANIARQVKDLISKGDISTIFETTKKITIPVGDISEPMPALSRQEGVVTGVVTGNASFRVGDRIPKPRQGGGQGGNGSGAGNEGDGADDFMFTLTRDEFLKYFFEDLELPNLNNTDIAVIDEYKSRKAGYSASGSPSNLSLLQTMKASTGRRVALRAAKKRKLRELEMELVGTEDHVTLGKIDRVEGERRIAELEAEIAALKKAIKKVPFVDEIDLRYRNTIQDPVPNTQAVMFCMLDVSGSMSQWHKDIAKRFFMLLYLFLHKRYERVEIVFIRHSHVAEEVDEQRFFYDAASGGTVVSSGLELIANIIKERYDRKRYNIYIAQASDGDNWGDDDVKVIEMMDNQLLPMSQFYFYVEISKTGTDGDLWHAFKKITSTNFDAVKATSAAEVYQVFRKLFSGHQQTK